MPLRLRVGFTELGQTALKIVWLGEHTDNPVIDPVMIAGMDGFAQAQLTVPAGVDVPLVAPLADHGAVSDR